MATTYNRFYDQLQSLIDSINHDSDTVERLANLQRFAQDASALTIRSRDDAAYELRTRYSSEDAEKLAGVARRYIDYWAHRHRERNGLPKLKKRYKDIDYSTVMDLSGTTGPSPDLHPHMEG